MVVVVVTTVVVTPVASVVVLVIVQVETEGAAGIWAALSNGVNGCPRAPIPIVTSKGQPATAVEVSQFT